MDNSPSQIGKEAGFGFSADLTLGDIASTDHH